MITETPVVPLPPLPDLHRHLDGSMRLATLRALAAEAGVALPREVRFTPGMGLAGALARFEKTVACLQAPAAIARVADEICADAADDGVTTLEIRFAPQLHRAGGATMADAVDAALEGIAGRAGLVLCVLYGDAPALAERLVSVAGRRPGVVGVDLAGGPAPKQRWVMADYADAFAEAARLGLGRTVHAGEGRPAAEIAEAIDRLGAQRIGHGTTLLDDPRLLERVVEEGIVIEACPTSNVHTGALARIEDHPLPRWLALGVRACINPDNTLLSDVSASAEHRRAGAIPGMTAEMLADAIAYGHAAAFTRA